MTKARNISRAAISSEQPNSEGRDRPKDDRRKSVLLNPEERARSFEEWLKISADNKINGQNTWDLALIEYFADMTLLREGDSINFQKASHTLDGCVKVYTSRIDSVDSETRQLLQGLAKNDENIDAENTEANPKEQAKKKRVLSSTLVDNASISNETLELDFAHDPLFQKTAADLDQGGATGLLLATLDIAPSGRIIFDASDPLNYPTIANTFECDVAALEFKFGSRLLDIHKKVICPTFESFLFNSDDCSFALTVEDRSDFYYHPSNLSDTGSNADNNDYYGSNDYDMGTNDYDDAPVDHRAELNEHFARLTAEEQENGLQETTERVLKMVNSNTISEDNKFLYFHEIKGKQWAGPEYWKARAIKQPVAQKLTRTKKVKTAICFVDVPSIDPATCFNVTKTSLLLPKTGTKKELNLLPVDLKYDSKRFARMFMKPEYSFQEFFEKVKHNGHQPEPMRDQYDDQGYADFGIDDDHDQDIDPGPDPDFQTSFQQPTGPSPIKFEKFKSTIEPLTFARTAKRVNVLKLKENLWNTISIKPDESLVEEENPAPTEKSFTEIIKKLDDCYEEKPRKDISVAFCFICVLHLANENNLSIDGNFGMNDLVIRG